MPSQKPILTIRTNQNLIDKIKYISEKQNRSMSNMSETILKEYIEAYETEHSEIIINEQSTKE